MRQITGAAWAGVHEGSLRERAQRLRDMLTNLEPLIAYVAARFASMLKRRKAAGLILVFARDALCAVRHAADPVSADTS